MAQTRQQIVDLLESIGREPNRKLGQHFMIEPTLIERLLAETGLADNPLVLEIGPGTGTLTESLLAAGAEVVAVEIDEHLADLLEAEVGSKFPGRLHIVRGDVLSTKHKLNDQMLDSLTEIASGRPARLVANLPYNIASPLVAELVNMTVVSSDIWTAATQIERLLDQADAASSDSRSSPRPSLPVRPAYLDRLVFTVQREVAGRLTSRPGTKEYGPLSVLCQGLGVIHTVVGKISPNAFYPKPNVFSAMLRIDLPAERLAAVNDLDALHAWLDAGFGHRRKTLAASIKLMDPEWQVRLTAAAVACGLDLSRRGETLAVEEYLQLARET